MNIQKKSICALVTICISMLVMGLFAGAVDVSSKCSMTVAAGDTAQFSEFLSANIPVKIYRVASMNPDNSFTAVEGYTDLDVAHLNEETTSDGKRTDKWMQQEQKAAEMVAGKEPDARFTISGGTGTLADLQTGLYLLVIDQQIIGDYQYTWSPTLLALPSMDWDTGEVLYDINGQHTVTLKPEKTERTGDLRINKTLTQYSSLQQPASFVFQIEAVKNGETVYSNVLSMTFTEPGQQSELIEGLPVGAQVTVTEVYSGSSYQVTTDAEQTVTIAAEDVVDTAFTNEYTRQLNPSSSVENQFDPQEGTWSWTQVVDGEVVEQQ